jgi:predicted transcriptional regulator
MSASVTNILAAIRDSESLTIFNAISVAKRHDEIQITKFGLSRKQYYSRIARLKNAGLIRKENGNYFLTALGAVVYEAQSLISKALNIYWKVRAIDSIKAFGGSLPRQDLGKLIDSLIEDYEIKDLLLRHCCPSNSCTDLAEEKITAKA